MPHTTRRTPAAIEDLILDLRQQLTETLLERGTAPLPLIRTIGRVLQRRGSLDGK